MIGVGGRVDSCCTRSPGQPGANNRPPDTATAVSASDTVGSANRRPIGRRDRGRSPSPHRRTPAGRIRHHRIRIHRAQPHGEHRPHRLGTLGEAAQPAAHRLRRATPNPRRSGGTRARLVAFAASADTITAAVSARRSNAVTGNNTCVTRQPVHRDRRGHSSTGPSGPRNCRGLARPQPVSTPPHAGQLNSPAASLRST